MRKGEKRRIDATLGDHGSSRVDTFCVGLKLIVFTPADRQQRISYHQRCCLYVDDMVCRLLIGEDGGH